MLIYSFVVDVFCQGIFRIPTIAFLIIGGIILIAAFLKFFNSDEIVIAIAHSFRLIGALLIIGGIAFFINISSFKSGAQKYIGEVTKIQYEWQGDTESNQYEVFVKIDEFEVERKLYFDLKPNIAVGNRIPVYHKRVTFSHGLGEWRSDINNEHIRLILFGMLFFIPGILTLRRIKPKLKEEVLIEKLKANPHLVKDLDFND